MDWKLCSTIKAKNEDGAWHSNLVGVMHVGDPEQIEKGEAPEGIYKVSRLPNHRGFWEFLVSHALKENIPGIKNFARVTAVHKLAFDVDNTWKTLPSAKNKTNCRDRYVMLQKEILGYSFAKRIKFKCSEDLFFSILWQGLTAHHIAQSRTGFTHYDLHGNNVLLKKEDIPKGATLFYLYEIGKEAILVPSFGYRAKIIDYEFSYVEAAEGKPFDSRLDLINIGYVPCVKDIGYDSIRFVVSCCNYMYSENGSLTARRIMEDLVEEASTRTRCFDMNGLLEDREDWVRSRMLKLFEKKHEREFVELRYYHLIGMLLHNATVPLRKVPDLEDSLFVNFVQKMLQFDRNRDRCCVALFEFLDGNRQEYITKKGQLWTSELEFLLHSCSDMIQNLYCHQIEQIREERQETENQFSSLQILKKIVSRHDIKIEIRNADIIHWMNPKERRKKVIILPEDRLEILNASYDPFIRGEKILRWLKKENKKR